MFKQTKGITLIALIITIIILIILTAITLNNVIGTDLIGFATKAAENYTDAAREEEDVMRKAMALSAGKATAEDSKVQPGTPVTSDTEKEMEGEITYNYTDVIGRHAMVPEGFKVSTKVSEQFVDDGLVVQDADGNEFVWIPCDEKNKQQFTNAKDYIVKEDWFEVTNFKEIGGGDGSGWTDFFDDTDIAKLNEIYTGENKLTTDDWTTENQIEIGKTSIMKYGGFYIARYEAGVPENATFHISNTEGGNKYVNTQNENIVKQRIEDSTAHARGSVADTSIIKDLKPISKQGVQVWNYITHANAKVVSENMYKNSVDSKGNKVGVKSYLVDSQAWNYICKNIYEEKLGIDINDKTTCEWGNCPLNSTVNYESLNCLWASHLTGPYVVATEYGNGEIPEDKFPIPIGSAGYRDLELSTGASDSFKKYNIYDMLGNVWEWTTTHVMHNGRMYNIGRGGSFMEWLPYPVVTASTTTLTSSALWHFGFRVVLYIND